MKTRLDVKALHAMHIEFRQASTFTKGLLQHLDEQMQAQFPENVKMPSVSDVQNLMKVPEIRQDENSTAFALVGTGDSDQAQHIVVGTEESIKLWQAEHQAPKFT